MSDFLIGQEIWIYPGCEINIYPGGGFNIV